MPIERGSRADPCLFGTNAGVCRDGVYNLGYEGGSSALLHGESSSDESPSECRQTKSCGMVEPALPHPLPRGCGAFPDGPTASFRGETATLYSL